MSGRVIAGVFLGLSLGLQACSTLQASSSGNAPQKLVITGSSTVAPIASEIAKRYEAQNPQVRIDVQTGGSSRGIADVRQQVADIGMVSRAAKSEDQGLNFHTIAKDGVVVIVHRDNPIQRLTRQQITDIYTDQLNNWQDAGGKSQAITVVNKAEGRSTLEVFTQHFQLKSSQIKADVVIGDNEQGIKTVAGNPLAIGYVSVGAAKVNVEQGTPIKVLPLEGIQATAQTVRDGSFPLSRPLNLVTQGSLNPQQQKFIDFAQSSQVKDIVQEQSLVPVQE
ncbi:phosphate ABC transporter substrate-binding protein [Acaryochloris marina]|uniref:phosphate ABC transporter substrate-binding protein n=1 Tax=Acaryochloris marina TaxID=155978 RepID=UPI002016D9BE|nr:phosphate ABC transporter substrate-binding protein [Acaryochloris marina]QUY42925.1 phosphate ABC transporter substrate-binding protein [Acaryochloris marina S15]